MKATISWITDNFKKFNEKYFNGYLNMPYNIRTSSRCSKALGKITPRRSYWGGIICTLTMSTYYDRTEHSLQETLLHEMIHLYQFQKYGKADHGETFKREARRINRDGWNISRITKLDDGFIDNMDEQVKNSAIHKLSGKYCGMLEHKGDPFFFCVSEKNLDRTAQRFKGAKFYKITKPETFIGFSITGSGYNSITGKRAKKGSKLYENIMNSIGNEVEFLSLL